MKKAAEFLKVLADEARLNMLWLLLNHGELCVCDIMEVLEVTQSKASRHLRILYNAGLLTERRAGLWTYYSVQPAKNDFGRNFLEPLRITLADRQEAVELLKKLNSWLEQKGQTKCG